MATSTVIPGDITTLKGDVSKAKEDISSINGKPYSARTVISRIPSCLAVKCRTPEGI